MAESLTVGPSLHISDEELGDESTWEEIGRGGFSVVYRVFVKLHNGYVAVKKLNSDQNTCVRESEKLLKLSTHDHIVKIKGVRIKRRLIIMEYCKYNMQTLRNKLGTNYIPWPRCVTFMQHIMSGLEFLHYSKITHRDLKPENIMLTETFICKIADFGLAKGQDSHTNNANTGDSRAVCPSGTPIYQSPARWKEPFKRATEADDLYSCALLFYKMITNADLFYMEGRNRDDAFISDMLHYLVDKNYRPEIKEIMEIEPPPPPIVAEVIEGCWSKDEPERKTFKDWGEILRNFIETIPDEEKKIADQNLVKLLNTNTQQLTTAIPVTAGTSSMSREEPYDEHDSQFDDNETVQSLQPEDITRDLSDLEINSNDIDVIIMYGPNNVMKHYKLESEAYKLSLETRNFHFHRNGNRSSIPTNQIEYCRTEDANTVKLCVWIGLQQQQPLILSASSPERISTYFEELGIETNHPPKHTMGELTGADFYRETRPPPYAPYTAKERSHNQWHNPNPLSPQPSSYPCHSQPLQTNITIENVNKFIIHGGTNTFGQSMPINDQQTYERTRPIVLTESNEMVTTEILERVKVYVATRYDLVGRLLKLEAESKAIKLDNPGLQEASYQLLDTWLNTHGSQATKRVLANILLEAGLDEAARGVD